MSILKKIKSMTGIRPSQSFLFICFIVLFLALFDILAALLTTLFGMIYPAYMSWKVCCGWCRRLRRTMRSRRRFGWLIGSFLGFWPRSMGPFRLCFLLCRVSMRFGLSCMFGCFIRGRKMGRRWSILRSSLFYRNLTRRLGNTMRKWERR